MLTRALFLVLLCFSCIAVHAMKDSESMDVDDDTVVYVPLHPIIQSPQQLVEQVDHFGCYVDAAYDMLMDNAIGNPQANFWILDTIENLGLFTDRFFRDNVRENVALKKRLHHMRSLFMGSNSGQFLEQLERLKALVDELDMLFYAMHHFEPGRGEAIRDKRAEVVQFLIGLHDFVLYPPSVETKGCIWRSMCLAHQKKFFNAMRYLWDLRGRFDDESIDEIRVLLCPLLQEFCQRFVVAQIVPIRVAICLKDVDGVFRLIEGNG